ncbi:unnamed protein product [Lepeophtheirus salmonis]|uniref:(salmon louse) hypothetical protein n=1 Tax=Lepeophtheirus salmonis TaxID=72036 RepID=A0A7R8H868_LEPSM|nr:unnamed protein product [Lepeophtheirus salmonis]CAF2931893.1 unnamed protein product [Lepeophtheirus salmonis]
MDVNYANQPFWTKACSNNSGIHHIAEYLLQLAESSIKKCEDNFRCNVCSIVRYNGVNIIIMWKLLEESTEHNIISYGCAANLLNLLAQDLEIDNIKEYVCFIVKYFRNNHYAGAKYSQEGGPRLIMPQTTRCNTVSDCFKIYSLVGEFETMSPSSEFEECFEHCWEEISADGKDSIKTTEVKDSLDLMGF